MAAAPMNKTVKWILIAVLIVVAIAITILIVKYFSQPTAPANNTGAGGGAGGGGGANPSGSNNVIPGIIDALSGVFNNIFGGGGKTPAMSDPACDKNSPGYDNNGYYTKKCGGVDGGGDGNCNPNDPGKDLNGFSNSLCGG